MFKKIHDIAFGKIDPRYHSLIERWISILIIVLLYNIL